MVYLSLLQACDNSDDDEVGYYDQFEDDSDSDCGIE
jgi:hypothetical protein